MNRRDPGLRAGPELLEREPSSISGAAGAGLADTPERLAMGAQMLALLHLTVSSLARTGAMRSTRSLTPVPPEGSEVGLNSTGRSLFGPGLGNGNSLLPDQDSLFRSLGNSLKKRSDLAGFELIQRLDRPQK